MTYIRHLLIPQPLEEMTETEAEAPAVSPTPPLTEEDYNAPFLKETTSFTMVLLVLVALVLTCALVVFAIVIA